jgi:hypothetical protein
MAQSLARLLGACALVLGSAVPEAAVVYLTTAGPASSGVIQKNITVPFVANSTFGGAMSAWAVLQAAQYTLPVNITIAYEWIPAPFNCRECTHAPALNTIVAHPPPRSLRERD